MIHLSINIAIGQKTCFLVPYLLAYKTGIFPQDLGLKLGACLIGRVYRNRKWFTQNCADMRRRWDLSYNEINMVMELLVRILLYSRVTSMTDLRSMKCSKVK